MMGNAKQPGRDRTVGSKRAAFCQTTSMLPTLVRGVPRSPGAKSATQYRATEHWRSLCHTVDRQDAADIDGVCAPPLVVVPPHFVVNCIALSPPCLSS